MAETAHRRFLELLGWQGAELEAFLPEWMNAAEFLRLSDADVAFAVDEWLPQYWDMSLEGTRKCIAAVIREAAALARTADYLAAGDAVIYATMPSS